MDFPIENGDFPIENGDFPIENGDFPIENGGSFHSFLLTFTVYRVTLMSTPGDRQVTLTDWVNDRHTVTNPEKYGKIMIPSGYVKIAIENGH